MIDPKDISAKAQALQDRLKETYGVRARDLEGALRKTGRRLPRRLHKQARYIIESQELAGHPKLSRFIDHTAISQTFDAISEHLDTVDPREQRKDYWLSVAGNVAMSILVVGAVVVTLLVWRDLI